MKIAIVTLVHNQLEFTTQMMKSLFLFTNKKLFDLYVVNNNSDDGTSEYLDYIKNKYTNVTILTQSTNLGFSEGNNVAFKHIFDNEDKVKYDYVLELNNDIILSPYWCESVVDASKHKKGIGIVGPVSNAVMSHQQVNISIPNVSIDNVANAARNYRNQTKFKYSEEGIVSGFCMLIDINLLRKFGYYPSDLTMYDDNLLCLYALNSGYKIICDRSTFIYHYGSKTFQEIDKNLQQTFNENYGKFIDIWKKDYEGKIEAING